jgi:hypothetical protein
MGRKILCVIFAALLLSGCTTAQRQYVAVRLAKDVCSWIFSSDEGGDER